MQLQLDAQSKQMQLQLDAQSTNLIKELAMFSSSNLDCDCNLSLFFVTILGLAPFFMKGLVLVWFKWLHTTNQLTTWPEFTRTIRKYTFNIGYLEHSTSVLKPMLKVTMLNV